MQKYAAAQHPAGTQEEEIVRPQEESRWKSVFFCQFTTKVCKVSAECLAT